MRQFIKRIIKTILVGYVIKFIRNKLSGKSSHPTDNNIIKIQRHSYMIYEWRCILFCFFYNFSKSSAILSLAIIPLISTTYFGQRHKLCYLSQLLMISKLQDQ